MRDAAGMVSIVAIAVSKPAIFSSVASGSAVKSWEISFEDSEV